MRASVGPFKVAGVGAGAGAGVASRTWAGAGTHSMGFGPAGSVPTMRCEAVMSNISGGRLGDGIGMCGKMGDARRDRDGAVLGDGAARGEGWSVTTDHGESELGIDGLTSTEPDGNTAIG